MTTTFRLDAARAAWNDWAHHPSMGRATDAARRTGWTLLLLTVGALLRGTDLALAFLRGVLKALMCVAAGLGAGLVTVGVFALRQPALWDYEVIQHTGPPVGPVALGAGVALLTAQALLLACFFRSWRRFVAGK